MAEDRAHAAVTQALAAIERHLSGDRDEHLGEPYDPQLERFRAMLLRLKAQLDAGKRPTVTGVMAKTIADNWPYESNLAEVITRAEQECDRVRAPRAGNTSRRQRGRN